MSAARGDAFLTKAAKVAVVAPHPDDETFGAGGIIADRCREGAEVQVVVLTSGDASHNQCCGMANRELQIRREEGCRKALGILGVPGQHIHFLKLKDSQLAHPAQCGFEVETTQLGDILHSIDPQQIFAPHPLEGWSDHLAAEQLTRSALARIGSSADLYHYCVWFWFSLPLRRAFKVDWARATCLDITGVMAKKRAAMRVYLDDLAPCGNPYCGRLPAELVGAFQWRKELFFKARARESGMRGKQGRLPG